MDDIDKYKWMNAIASKYGPRNPTTRHVLLTLSLHMNQRGDNAWPSQSLLAERTELSERSVQKHLKLAEKLGWLKVYDKGTTGQGWRLHGYVATVPADLDDAAPDHPWESDPTWQRAEPDSARDRPCDFASMPERAERRSGPTANVERRVEQQRAESDAKGAEPHDTTSGTSRQKVRNDVPTNYPLTIQENYPKEGAPAASAPASPPLAMNAGGMEKRQPEADNERMRLIARAASAYPAYRAAELARYSGTTIAEVKQWQESQATA